MNHHAVIPQASKASIKQDAAAEQRAEIFRGFEPLNSNYVYCPNQFFDICLKSSSRGMVRIVAYILRQTLGWLDENGQPVNQRVKVSYQDLITKAGVSRGAISKALQLAVASGFLDCCVIGNANAKGRSSQSAEYTLRWDENGEYTGTYDRFEGFFAGDGNRTPVPNSFFDSVIPAENLAVVKVVGAVIRHTVGYQTQFGGRRKVTPLSCSFIQRYTNLSNRRNLIAAIRRAESAGYITKEKAGSFSPVPSEQSATSYSIRWLQTNKNSDSGSKMTPAAQQFKNDTSNGSRMTPAERFKNDTSIEITNSNKILKQQTAAADLKTRNQLIEVGFDDATANDLIEKRGVAVAQKQLDWIDARKPENRSAMLRRAIEEDWSEPASFAVKQKLADARKRDAMRDAAKRSEERIINQRKAARASRKSRLLTEWDKATHSERAEWIAAAAKRQTATMLQQIIAKQNPTTEKPHAQVLDEIAFAKSLPAVTEPASLPVEPSAAEQPKTQPQSSAIESKPNSLRSPRTKKRRPKWRRFEAHPKPTRRPG
ncbi:hypothetical protein [Mariniblastus fucicola]|uniref:Uncharacterized protein n=1 Tax=Mariniblastus fucicola TaxID=980251 RepID=A0A5B9P7W6_9BACT|nr:hypothetical protein [Mariniblastus fucicola]QEG21000.1 hypothetical protein MFFC18_08520 [Mariniblastus fucicola]